MHQPHNNSLLPRTAGAITLCLIGNEQGSHYFLSLYTGKRVWRNDCTVLPILAKVIATTHQCAAACKNYKDITFTDKDGNIINNANDTKDDIPNNIEITGVDEERNGNTQELDSTGVPSENSTGVWLKDTKVESKNKNNQHGNINNEGGNSPEDDSNINNENGNTNDEYRNTTDDEYGNTPEDKEI